MRIRTIDEIDYIYPKISHDFAVCHRSNGDKHLKEFTLRQILRQVIDDQIGPRRIITGTTRIGAGRWSVIRSSS
jgi:hypothetical protein